MNQTDTPADATATAADSAFDSAIGEALTTGDGCDERILASLRRIIRAVDLYSRYLALRYSLTGPQLVCVRQLLKHGSMTPGELAKRISLSPATITGIVDRLEKRGLVTRERSQEDKRKVVIALTPAGEQQVEQMPPPLHETFLRRLEQLSEDEQDEIDEVLAKIVDMMEAQDMADSPLYATDAPLPATTLSPFLNSGQQHNNTK
ncbi:MAG: MarR family transcriptional regulator [Gammaproteobacteria bacterium]|nr:MarR family transcriptional regulator [Gammaproteobacteria bacterium]